VSVFDLADMRSVDRLSWQAAARGLARDLSREPQRMPAVRVRSRDVARAATDGANPSLLEAIRSVPHSEPVIIRGIPVLPDDGRDPCADLTNDLLLLGLIEAADLHVFSYNEQKNGALVQDIVPVPGKELSNSNAGRVPLGWHTDDAVFKRPHRAEGIALLCIDNTAATRTYFVGVDQLIERFDAATIDVLRQPRYRFATPESFHIFGGKIVYSELAPVLAQGSAGSLEVSCAEYSTRVATGDDEACRALETFKEALAQCEPVSIVLQPGDCLVFSNVGGLHARDAVEGARHLKRSYFRGSLQALREATRSRPDETVFSCEDFILT
jgi:L-asparagine oxygenase